VGRAARESALITSPPRELPVWSGSCSANGNELAITIEHESHEPRTAIVSHHLDGVGQVADAGVHPLAECASEIRSAARLRQHRSSAARPKSNWGQTPFPPET